MHHEQLVTVYGVGNSIRKAFVGQVSGNKEEKLTLCILETPKGVLRQTMKRKQ